MKKKNNIMIVALVFLAACSSDNRDQDVQAWKLTPDTSVNDAGSGKDIATENDIKDADKTLDASDQDNLKVCEAIPPALSFKPGRNFEELLGCEITLSAIHFIDYFETKITGLDALRKMGSGGGLIFHRTPDLIDVNTFANLELIKDDFSIDNAPMLADLTGFRSLSRVEGELNLVDMTIKNFNGLQNLEYVGKLRFWLIELESFDGLENLTEIKGKVSVSAPKISEAQFRAFLKGKKIGGDIVFQGEPFIL